jgi:hypothetical protein
MVDTSQIYINVSLAQSVKKYEAALSVLSAIDYG